MKLAVAIVAGLMMCGLFAATSSTTLGVGAACVTVLIAVLYAKLIGIAARIWVVCVVTTLCSFPVIALPQNLRVGIMATLTLSLVFVLLDWRVWVPRAFGGWVVYYVALGLGTVLYSPAGDTGAYFVFGLFALSALPAVVVTGSLIRRGDIPVLVAALFTGVAVQVAITSIEVFGFGHALWNVRFEGRTASAQAFENTLISGIDRGTGTFGHPLPQAFLYVVAFGIAITMGNRIANSVRVTVYALCVCGALLGSARSALLAMAMVVIGATLYRSVFRTALLIVALGTGLVATNDRYQWIDVIGLDKFSASGSYTHRVGVISALPDVLNRPLAEVLIGHGVRGQAIILDFLSDNVSAIDNQYISAIIMSGIAGFTALAYIFVSAWRNSPDVRLTIVGMAMMFLSFDVYSWQSTLAITASVLGIATSNRLSNERKPAAVGSCSPAQTAASTTLPSLTGIPRPR